MSVNVLRGLFFALIFIVALPPYAEIESGNITGRVTDSTGAVIVGAQVTATQTAMNFESVTQTNEEGIYQRKVYE